MKIPTTYTNKNETGCCAIPNVKAWDKREVEFSDEHFIRMYTRSILFMPLNMAKVMKQIHDLAEEAGAMMPPQDVMILSREMSPWKAEQLYRVTKPVDGADNVVLNGTFEAMVFEGPFQDAGKWQKALQQYVQDRGKTLKHTYFFYTTCPNCAKHYGKNYTIGLAEVAS